MPFATTPEDLGALNFQPPATTSNVGARNTKSLPQNVSKRSAGQLTFRVQPQTPAEDRPIAQEETVFAGIQVPAMNVRFKPSHTPVSATPPHRSLVRQAVSKREISTIQFTKNKTTKGFTPRREKCDTPPPKKQRTGKYPRTNTEPVLTSRRPVCAFVPIDAWVLIFQRCNPKFLLTARLVCRDFNAILAQKSIWRESRINQYGESIPDCPRELSEFQYANLLVGRGCQVRPCTQRLTRKVYWAFLLRMCEQCFTQCTQLPGQESEEAEEYVKHYEQLEAEVKATIPRHLSGLLPACSLWAGRFSQIRSLNRERQMWRHQDDSVNYYVVAKDYETLKDDFRAKVTMEPTYFLFWARLHWTKTKERIRFAKETDAIDRDFLDQPVTHRNEKKAFFADMAQELDPPMTYAVLNKMAAYHKAIDTANSASLRAWDGLAAKITISEVREQAEKLVKWGREEANCTESSSYDSLYDKLAEHRARSNGTQKESPEQQFVLNIARIELDKLLNVVDDEDVLLMLLQNVRHAFESANAKPDGLNGDGNQGEYSLWLDDARMVVTDVLMPIASGKGPIRGKKLMSSLRCIACARTDCTKTYSFEALMNHVRVVHADRVGQSLHFWRLAVPTLSRTRIHKDTVAWYLIPWPKTFPALPGHQKATTGMVWNPDLEVKYVQGNIQEGLRLFDSLDIAIDPEIAASDVTSNVCKAVKVFEATRLDSLATLRIGLEYARRRSATSLEEESIPTMLSIAGLEGLEVAVRAISTTIEFKFKCGLCLKDPALNQRGRQARETLYPQPLTSLRHHWQHKHNLTLESSVEKLIELPSDAELYRSMNEEDAKLDQQRAKAIHKKKTSRRGASGQESTQGNNARTNDPRSEALLDIPSIRSRFGLLFVPHESRDTKVVDESESDLTRESSIGLEASEIPQKNRSTTLEITRSEL